MSFLPSLGLTRQDMVNSALRVTGIVASAKICNWLGRVIEDKTGLTFGDFLDKVVPFYIQEKSFELIMKLREPIGYLNIKAFEYFGLHFANFAFAPGIEELIFRFGIQGGIKFALLQAGLPSQIAEPISIGLAAYLFTFMHSPDIRGRGGSEVFTAGVAYGYARESGNTLEAILTHALYNILVRLGIH